MVTNVPPKGSSDWLPEEMQKRLYIFETWRKVCFSFGFQEYLTPLLEYAELFKAKSGEDVGGKELMTLTDRGGRELAIRPEMTPGVTRMVSRFYDSLPKPIKLFSIANFIRNEKPQKGRNREFWQLNCDIFGSTSIYSEVEILKLSIEILNTFGAKKFVVFVNNKFLSDKIISSLLLINDQKNLQTASRIIDKFNKISKDELFERLKNEANADLSKKNLFYSFLLQDKASISKIKSLFEADFKRLDSLIKILDQIGYSSFIKYNPSLVRGFDYYDGIVFEVFDSEVLTNKEESFRSLFGGGRYNGLAGIFGQKTFPAIGFAPGDETTKIYLEKYNLFPSSLKPKLYYLPLLSKELIAKTNAVAKKLRAEGKVILEGLAEESVKSALSFANKIKADFTVLFGENEEKRNLFILKDMYSGEQQETKL